MGKGIFGRKIGMTQIFEEDGTVVPVTVVQVNSTVIRKKSEEGKDGYAAIVLGYEDVRSAQVDGETVYKAKKPHLGVFSKAELAPKRYLSEVRVSEKDLAKYEIGQDLDTALFYQGEKINVTGTSKGRGFSGVMKRHNMAGGKATHGVHEAYRHGGSIGCSATPSRVFKGKEMPGQYGNARVTVQNLTIHRIDADENLLLIKGAVPGPTGGIVMVADTSKGRRS